VVEILERGAVSFLAVPRPGAEAAAEVERLFLVLAPDGKRPLRRLSVRRRRLPDPSRPQRFLAHVDRIATVAARLTEDVRGAEGEPGSRVLAVGRYALARHRDHVHLAYALARACARGARANAVGVAAGASFVLCVFRRSLPPTRRPAAGAALAPATPERLDVLGAELALVAGERRAAAPAGPDRVGDALVGALLRRGPRPRVASFAGASSVPRGAQRPRGPRPARRPGARTR
jgi:hypothetical protein